MGNFKEDIAKVKAFVFDVDGVFTDGSLTPVPDGDYLRTYNTKDSYAVMSALKAGYKIAVITGGVGKMIEARFRAFGVTSFTLGCMDKLPVMCEFMEEHSLVPEQVMYMGDDIPDLGPLKYVGMPVCPADAATEVVRASRYISQFNGGRGCVRDVIEQVMRSHGKWAKSSVGFAVGVPKTRD